MGSWLIKISPSLQGAVNPVVGALALNCVRTNVRWGCDSFKQMLILVDRLELICEQSKKKVVDVSQVVKFVGSQRCIAETKASS